MPAPVLYSLGQIFTRLGVRAYFRDVDVQHVERVPRDGPVIVAANHPQSIVDAVILGLAMPRVVRYLAHSGLFANPIRGFFLRQAGVIPVHRRQDASDAAARNVESFEACCEVLRAGGCVGIFPEGTSEEARRVQPLKTGSARIALEAEGKNDFGLGLSIVPAGLSFQSRRRFRSRVLVHFGRPIVIADYRELFEADPMEAARAITDRLENAIRYQVVDVRQSDLEGFVRQVERVYKHELRERPGLEVPGLSRFERDQYLAREIARAADYFYANHPETIWGMAELLDQYQRRLDRVGIADRMLREEGQGFARAATGLAVFGLVGLPVAAWGLVANLLPYLLTIWVTRMRRPDATKVHWTQFTRGSVFFVMFYALLVWWAYGLFGGWATFAITLSLPLSGLFAWAWVGTMVRRRKELRFAWLRGTRGIMVQSLRNFRREIIEAMDEALAVYLARPDGAPSGKEGE